MFISITQLCFAQHGHPHLSVPTPSLQALVDNEVAVVADAVRCLAAVCGHLRKRSLLAAVREVSPLLRHRSAAVRHSAVAFIAAAARDLPPVDAYTQLRVMISGHLQQQPLMLTGDILHELIAQQVSSRCCVFACLRLLKPPAFGQFFEFPGSAKLGQA